MIVGRTGAPGLIAYSEDTIDWTDVTVDSAAPGDLRGAARGLSHWVAVGTNQVNGVVMVPEAVGGGESVAFFENEIQVGAQDGTIAVAILAGPAVSWTVPEDADWTYAEIWRAAAGLNWVPNWRERAESFLWK